MPYRDRNKHRESVRRAVAKLYAARRARRLCIYCGKRPPILGRMTCFNCAVRRAGYYRKRKKANRHENAVQTATVGVSSGGRSSPTTGNGLSERAPKAEPREEEAVAELSTGEEFVPEYAPCEEVQHPSSLATAGTIAASGVVVRRSGRVVDTTRPVRLTKREPDWTVVSDFSADGLTRGAIFPVADLSGAVLRARKPDGPVTDITQAVSKASHADRQLYMSDRQVRRKKRRAAWKRRYDLSMSYGEECQSGGYEYLVGVYTWKTGELVETPCRHHHRSVYTAIWCKDFPAANPPEHIVVAVTKTGRVRREVLPNHESV